MRYARIQLIFSLVALSIVFFACEGNKNAPTAEATATTASTGLSIVHIMSDSLQTGYTALAKELTRLEANFQAAQENLGKEGESLQRDVNRLQNKAQQGLLSPNQIQQEQQKIARREQEIRQKQEIAVGSIQQEQLELQNKFSQQVRDILEDLKAENGYDYVLNQGPGSGVLVSNPENDITDLVLERLNAMGENALSATPASDSDSN